MVRVYLGLGSNIERERYITAGLDALAALFGELAIYPVYDCPAVGFDGAPFLNLVVGVDTDLCVGELARRLRHIECEHGRPEHAPRYTSRHLDIDILTYADLAGRLDGVELPRGEILENAFVLRPLSELAPQAVHPVAGRNYLELWRAHDRPDQRLTRVDFDWRGRCISSP